MQINIAVTNVKINIVYYFEKCDFWDLFNVTSHYTTNYDVTIRSPDCAPCDLATTTEALIM